MASVKKFLFRAQSAQLAILKSTLEGIGQLATFDAYVGFAHLEIYVECALLLATLQLTVINEWLVLWTFNEALSSYTIVIALRYACHLPRKFLINWTLLNRRRLARVV